MSEEKRISADLIADIFNIPTDGKNISDDDEAAELAQTQTTVSFDDKSADVAAKIAEVSETPKAPKKIETKVEVKPEVKPEPKPEVKASVEDVLVKTAKPKKVAKEPEPELDMFADLGETEAPKVEAPKVEAKVETPKVESPKIVVPKVEAEKETPAIKVGLEGVKLEGFDTKAQAAIKQAVAAAATEFEEEENEKEASRKANAHSATEWQNDEDWILKSPGPKYDRFYNEKMHVLHDGRGGILAKGKLDFDALFDELAGLSCDMTITTYDSQVIYEKMDQIQKIRERVREIQLKVSRQYFMWKRYIELFRGILAGAEYIRGKQDGVCYDHMRDMEHYFCSLEALHKGTETIFKTLDAAFDVLSRQVTIIMPMKDIDRQMPNTNTSTPTPKPMTTSQKKYDSLGPVVDKSPSKTPGLACGWDALKG